MIERTRIKKLGQAYDFLSDCGEDELTEKLGDIMEERGYKVAVSKDKYVFKKWEKK